MSELTVTELMSVAGGNANSGYEGGCAASGTGSLAGAPVSCFITD